MIIWFRLCLFPVSSIFKGSTTQFTSLYCSSLNLNLSFSFFLSMPKREAASFTVRKIPPAVATKPLSLSLSLSHMIVLTWSYIVHIHARKRQLIWWSIPRREEQNLFSFQGSPTRPTTSFPHYFQNLDPTILFGGLHLQGLKINSKWFFFYFFSLAGSFVCPSS